MFTLPSIDPPCVNERKFSGDQRLREEIIALMECRCLPDGKYPEGRVNSLYFDTIGLRAYQEKTHGDHLKMKVRLRWYGKDASLPEVVPAYLELKRRIGSARNKSRLKIDVPRKLLLDTDYSAVEFQKLLAKCSAELDEPLAVEWHPVVQISYDRHRYVDIPSASRVSIDWNIQAPRFDINRFPWGSPVKLSMMVCEFKNALGEPPLWAEAMCRAGLRYGSFSKYGYCMSYLTEGTVTDES